MERITVIPVMSVRPRILIRPRLKIDPTKLNYLEDNGWKFNGNRYVGHFKTSRGLYLGEAQVENGVLDFFIYDPPQEVVHGPHSACFAHIGDDWWWIHFSNESPYPSDGIMAIERTIEQSLVLR